MKKYTIIDALLIRCFDFPLYMMMCYSMTSHTSKWISFYFFITYVIIYVIRCETCRNDENINELYKEVERLKEELKRYEYQKLEDIEFSQSVK